MVIHDQKLESVNNISIFGEPIWVTNLGIFLVIQPYLFNKISVKNYSLWTN
ncbi:hypothetical protein SAMN04487992_12019 [Cellulophaga baltica]|jgi:hypothetical protein|uniref:Uncharacterized protein n=1 Tax=Cellulophaga baltica TaxID=76594 RepID=A0A1G7LR90_9FLAO|nr:hypothetical protein SAMN04487992_12019 [Cellulophaga baltica]